MGLAGSIKTFIPLSNYLGERIEPRKIIARSPWADPPTARWYLFHTYSWLEGVEGLQLEIFSSVAVLSQPAADDSAIVIAEMRHCWK